MSFTIDDRQVDAATHVIEVGGALDLYTAPELKQRLRGVIEGGKSAVVVDLSEAAFVDSTTLGVLVAAAKRLRSAGGALALVCPQPSIRKVFDVTGLERVFEIHDAREDALSSVVASDSP